VRRLFGRIATLFAAIPLILAVGVVVILGAIILSMSDQRTLLDSPRVEIEAAEPVPRAC